MGTIILEMGNILIEAEYDYPPEWTNFTGEINDDMAISN